MILLSHPVTFGQPADSGSRPPDPDNNISTLDKKSAKSSGLPDSRIRGPESGIRDPEIGIGVFGVRIPETEVSGIRTPKTPNRDPDPGNPVSGSGGPRKPGFPGIPGKPEKSVIFRSGGRRPVWAFHGRDADRVMATREISNGAKVSDVKKNAENP